MNFKKSMFILSALLVLMSSACTEKEYMPSPDAEFPKNAEGVAIPIRNMSIKLLD